MRPLSKDERNDLFFGIEDSRLDPGECRYKLLTDGERGRITHAPSKSEFIVGVDYTTRRPVFVADTMIGDASHYVRANHKTIAELATSAREWADEVWVWTETPDLWELYRSGNEFFTGDLSTDSPNTPFTRDEQSAVSIQLRAIAATIKETYDLTAEQGEKLDEKFEEIENDGKRLGRKDWKNIALAGIFSLILTDVITPGISMHILMLMEHGIGHLVIGGPPTVRGILSAGQD
jgi:hypothetical protein